MPKQTRAPLRPPAERSPAPTAAAPQAPIREATVGLVAMREAMREKGLSAKALARLTGLPRSTIGDWQTQKTLPGEVARKVIQEHLGVDPSAWDHSAGTGPAGTGTDQTIVPMPGYGQPVQLDGSGQVQLFGAAVESEQSGKAGLRGAQQTLAELDRRLRDPSLTAGDAVKYLSAKLTAAKAVAQLSGEVDASESAAWVRSPEGRHFLAVLAEALRPYPDAGRAAAMALGVAYGDEVAGQDWGGDTAPRLAAESLTVESTEAWLERLTDWLSHPEQDPVIGWTCIRGIAYPTHGRERDTAEAHPDLARRIGDAFESGIARIQESKIAHEPWAIFCRRVAVRLRNEATRGDRIAELTRDYGPLVAKKAREAFG